MQQAVEMAVMLAAIASDTLQHPKVVRQTLESKPESEEDEANSNALALSDHMKEKAAE